LVVCYTLKKLGERAGARARGVAMLWCAGGERGLAGRCVAALASATWCARGGAGGRGLRSEYAWLRVALLSLAGARRACQRVGFSCDAGSPQRAEGPQGLAGRRRASGLMREWGGFFFLRGHLPTPGALSRLLLAVQIGLVRFAKIWLMLIFILICYKRKILFVRRKV